MPTATGTESPQKQISRGIVYIYKDYLGRGPTQARTIISDTIATTVCEDSLTKAEQRLVEQGDLDVVRNVRRKFQQAMSHDVIDLVEFVTGRRGQTLLSDHDVENDIAIETVVFADEVATNHSADENASSVSSV